MHIHELNPWRTLIAFSVFILLLVIGLLTMPKPMLSYEKSINETVGALVESDAYFYPWELGPVIEGKADNIVLFDIRNNFIFGQGHIPGTENMSANDLSKEENIERLKNLHERGITVVLCGADQLQANGPWMLFRQVGFDNVKILLGGYQYYTKHKDNLAATKDDQSLVKGVPLFDYAEMAAPKEGGVINPAFEKKPVPVQRKTKVAVAGGGC